MQGKSGNCCKIGKLAADQRFTTYTRWYKLVQTRAGGTMR